MFWMAAFVIVLLLIILYVFWMRRNVDKFTEFTCACVFDIDNTITCGLENAKLAVKECKKNNCKIALNTARTIPYYKDVKLEEIGLCEEDIVGDVYCGDYNKDMVSYDANYINKRVALTKVEHLRKIADKYGLRAGRVILFDDMIDNIKLAEEGGFSTVHANCHSCGLNDYVGAQIKDILHSK